MKHKVWARTADWLFLAVAACMRRAPVKLAYAVAAAGGTAAFFCWPRGRRNTLRNFRRVLPGATAAEVRGVARCSIANYGRYLVDFLRLPGLPAERVRRAVIGEQEFAALDRGLEQGRGVVIACMHFGNWDLGAAGATVRGYDLAVVAETFTSDSLDRMVVGSRERLGMEVLRMETAGPSLLRSLRRNGLLAVLVDRPSPGSGVRAPFFGAEVEVPAGPARLAIASGALIMPVAFARESSWSERVRVLAAEPFPAAATGDRDADVRATTAAILAAHEGFIRSHPDQWYMFRDMWPRRSAGA